MKVLIHGLVSSISVYSVKSPRSVPAYISIPDRFSVCIVSRGVCKITKSDC